MLNESALEKKKKMTEERTRRLLDPKVRVMGVDKTALDEQVKERSSLKKLESERESFYDQQSLMMDMHAQVLQKESEGIRLQREKDLIQYRDTYQRKDLRREFDLNDPKRVLREVPSRVGDDDPRCGPASLQKFEGEDLDSQNRKRVQAEQLREWAQQQMEEKLMHKWVEKEQTRVTEDRAEEAAFRAFQVQSDVAQLRKQAAVNNAEFNKAVAEQKRRQKLAERHDQTQKNLEEVQNMIDSDWLGETRDQTLNVTNPNRFRKDHFKGFDGDRRQDIVRAQQAQREDLRERRIREKEEEKQYAQQELMENRMAIALDRQRDRERREQTKHLGQERCRQAEEAAQRKKKMDELYRNEIGEEFFKFGKSL